jgi:hypothetical protein
MLKHKTTDGHASMKVSYNSRLVSGVFLVALLLLYPLTISANQKKALTAKGRRFDSANKLTKAEKSAGWRLLFDGKTTTGWRGFKKQEFPKQGWVSKDGCLKLLAKGGRDSLGGGDIITVDKFNDFETGELLLEETAESNT